MTPPFSVSNRFCRKRGLATLVCFVSILIPGPLSISLGSPTRSHIESLEFKNGVTRSQRILSALFLEQRYQYSEANRIWKTFPSSTVSVQDHIFQNEVASLETIEADNVPKTVQSLKIAVSYMKWRKRWLKAYHLLLSNPDRVAEDEELQMIYVMLALYVRDYKAAKDLLELLVADGIEDSPQLDALWCWYYLLTGRPEDVERMRGRLEEGAFYYPSSSILFNSAGKPWESVKADIIKTLTRFPSDRELFESAVMALYRNRDVEMLDAIIQSGSAINGSRIPWTIRVSLYLDNGRIETARQLLAKVEDSDRESVDFLSLRARVALAERNWDDLQIIAKVFRRRYPLLMDGELWMEIYLRHVAGDQ